MMHYSYPLTSQEDQATVFTQGLAQKLLQVYKEDKLSFPQLIKVLERERVKTAKVTVLNHTSHLYDFYHLSLDVDNTYRHAKDDPYKPLSSYWTEQLTQKVQL